MVGVSSSSRRSTRSQNVSGMQSPLIGLAVTSDLEQHRFGMNDIIDTANAVITAAAKSKDIRVSVPSAIADVVKKWVEKGVGDRLKTFKKKSTEDDPLLYRQELKYNAILRDKPEQGVHHSSSQQVSHLMQSGNQTISIGSATQGKPY